MAVPFVRVSLLGTLPGGEVWSVNPAFMGNFAVDQPDQDALQAWATAVANGVQGFVGQQLTNLMSQSAAIVGARCSYYDAAGKLQRYGEAQRSTPFAGSGSQTSATSSALVCSVYTSVLGRSGRGRIYWPALRMTLDQSTGRLTTGQLPALAGEFAAMFAGIEDAGPTGFAPILAVHSTAKGQNVAANRLQVGDVPDSQRRRRDAYQEQYAAVPYPA